MVIPVYVCLLVREGMGKQQYEVYSDLNYSRPPIPLPSSLPQSRSLTALYKVKNTSCAQEWQWSDTPATNRRPINEKPLADS